MKTKIVGGKIPPKEHKKLVTEDTIDHYLERLIFARETNLPFQPRQDCLFRPEDMGPMWTPHVAADDDMSFFHPEDINSPHVLWPLRFGFVSSGRSEDWGGDYIECNHFSSIEPAALRGRCARVGKYNLVHRQGYLDSKGGWVSVSSYAAWHFGRWVDAGMIRFNEGVLSAVRDSGGGPVTIGDRLESGKNTVPMRCAMGQSVAISYRYEWGAQFSIDNSPRIIVPTTPAGVRELFDDRDKPADQDRRAALRHWVRQHVRRSKREKFADVRAHLRGQVSFKWRGFDVTIRPSQFDEERNQVETTSAQKEPAR